MTTPTIPWPDVGSMLSQFRAYQQTVPWINLARISFVPNWSGGAVAFTGRGELHDIPAGRSSTSSQFITSTSGNGTPEALAPTFTRFRSGVYRIRCNRYNANALPDLRLSIDGGWAAVTDNGLQAPDAHSDYIWKFTVANTTDPQRDWVAANDLSLGYRFYDPGVVWGMKDFVILHEEDEADYWSNATEGFQRSYLNCLNRGVLRQMKPMDSEFRGGNSDGTSKMPGGRGMLITDWPEPPNDFFQTIYESGDIITSMSWTEFAKLLRVSQAKRAHCCFCVNMADGTVQAAMTIMRAIVPNIDIYLEEWNETWNNTGTYVSYGWAHATGAANRRNAGQPLLAGKYMAYNESDGAEVDDDNQRVYCVAADFLHRHYRETLAAGYPAAQVFPMTATQDGFPVAAGHMSGVWYRDPRVAGNPRTVDLPNFRVSGAPYIYLTSDDTIPQLADIYNGGPGNPMSGRWQCEANMHTASDAILYASHKKYIDLIKIAGAALQTFLNTNFPSKVIPNACYEWGYDNYNQSYLQIAWTGYYWNGNVGANTFDFNLAGSNSFNGHTLNPVNAFTAGNILYCFQNVSIIKRDGSAVGPLANTFLYFKWKPASTTEVYLYASAADRDDPVGGDGKGNYLVPADASLIAFSNFTKLNAMRQRIQTWHGSESGMLNRWYMYQQLAVNRMEYISVFQECGNIGVPNVYNQGNDSQYAGGTNLITPNLTPAQKLFLMLTYSGRV